MTHQIHAEGSLAAQEMMLYANADWDYYKAAAMRSANIPGWDKDPQQATMKDFKGAWRGKDAPYGQKLQDTERIEA